MKKIAFALVALLAVASVAPATHFRAGVVGGYGHAAFVSGFYGYNAALVLPATPLVQVQTVVAPVLAPAVAPAAVTAPAAAPVTVPTAAAVAAPVAAVATPTFAYGGVSAVAAVPIVRHRAFVVSGHAAPIVAVRAPVVVRRRAAVVVRPAVVRVRGR